MSCRNECRGGKRRVQRLWLWVYSSQRHDGASIAKAKCNNAENRRSPLKPLARKSFLTQPRQLSHISTTPTTATGGMSAGGGAAAASTDAAASSNAPPAAPTSEVERLLQRVVPGGNFAEVARLANQLLRKLAVKCKPGSLGKCEVCRPAVCVELACRQCGHLGVSREALVQQSMVKEAMYRDVFRRVEQALDLTSAWSVPQLAMVLGGEQAVKLAERILSEYQTRYSNSLQDGGRGGGQARPFAQQSLYVAAAFFLATKKLKVRKYNISLVTPGGDELKLCLTLFHPID